MKYVAGVGRFLLFVLLLSTGVGKALDVPGFTHVIDSYAVLPETLLLPAAVLMVVAELTLAAWLASGVRLGRAALASAALHGVFIAWISVALLRGLEIENCGCFGVFWARPLTGWTIVEDLVVVFVSLVTWRCSRAVEAERRTLTLAIS